MAVEDDLRTDCLPVIDQDDYATFRDIYLTRNVPVMFSAEVTAEWVSRRKWVQRQEEKQVSSIGYPEWDYLNRAHGHELVQVISCDDDEEELMGQSSILHIDDADMLPTTFGELLKVWRRGDGRTLYLKDWHLARQLACRENGGQQAIEAALHTVPKCWQDDWMNDYYSAETNDDFRFVYAGGGDTFTPLHRDVYTSYSISTNLCGSKRWYMFPPHLTPDLLPLIKAAENRGTHVDVSHWSRKEQIDMQRRGMLVVTQYEGETIFVPSGWYHSVVNLTHPTISLNHNWCNTHNITSIYNSMCQEVAQCRAAIDDVRDLLQRKVRTDNSDWRVEWEACVSDLVRQSAGWDWMTMWRMIRHALKSASSSYVGVAEPSSGRRWPRVDPSARPSTSFIVDKISPLLADFLTRPEEEHRWIPGLGDVLDELSALLRCSQVS